MNKKTVLGGSLMLLAAFAMVVGAQAITIPAHATTLAQNSSGANIQSGLNVQSGLNIQEQVGNQLSPDAVEGHIVSGMEADN